MMVSKKTLADSSIPKAKKLKLIKESMDWLVEQMEDLIFRRGVMLDKYNLLVVEKDKLLA